MEESGRLVSKTRSDRSGFTRTQYDQIRAKAKIMDFMQRQPAVVQTDTTRADMCRHEATVTGDVNYARLLGCLPNRRHGGGPVPQQRGALTKHAGGRFGLAANAGKTICATGDDQVGTAGRWVSTTSKMRQQRHARHVLHFAAVDDPVPPIMQRMERNQVEQALRRDNQSRCFTNHIRQGIHQRAIQAGQLPTRLFDHAIESAVRGATMPHRAGDLKPQRFELIRHAINPAEASHEFHTLRVGHEGHDLSSQDGELKQHFATADHPLQIGQIDPCMHQRGHASRRCVLQFGFGKFGFCAAQFVTPGPNVKVFTIHGIGKSAVEQAQPAAKLLAWMVAPVLPDSVREFAPPNLVEQHPASHAIGHRKRGCHTVVVPPRYEYIEMIFIDRAVAQPKASPATIRLDGPSQTLHMLGRFRERGGGEVQSALGASQPAPHMKDAGEQGWHIESACAEFGGIEFALGLLWITLEVRLGQHEVALGFSKWSSAKRDHRGVCQTKRLVGPPAADRDLGAIEINLGLRHELSEISEGCGSRCEHGGSAGCIPHRKIGAAETPTGAGRFNKQPRIIELGQYLLEGSAGSRNHANGGQYFGPLGQNAGEVAGRIDRDQSLAGLLEPVERISQSTASCGQIGEIALGDRSREVGLGILECGAGI